MLEPNLFIVGAPKCGTTALHEYLATHPQIFMTELKEPHHYSTDLPGRGMFFDRREYLKLFATARPQQTIRGESSVYYLYSGLAIRRILAEHPQAKFIAMLRNPVDLVQSLHAQLQTNLNENEPDFRTAWDLQAARQQGNSLPPNCQEPRCLQYRDIALLGRQLQRAMQIVPAQQLLTIVFDDFCRDSAGCYQQVLSFLGLADDGRTEFPRINGSSALRSKWVRQLLDERRLPEWFRRAGRQFGLHRWHVKLKSWNEKAAARVKIDPAFRSELVATFDADVKLASQLLNRDLTHWLAL